MYRFGNKLSQQFSALNNPYAKNYKQLKVEGKNYNYYSLPDLNDARLGKIQKASFFNIGLC